MRETQEFLYSKGRKIQVLGAEVNRRFLTPFSFFSCRRFLSSSSVSSCLLAYLEITSSRRDTETSLLDLSFRRSEESKRAGSLAMDEDKNGVVQRQMPTFQINNH